MPHYYTLSPFEEPFAYLAFGLHWLSSLICIFVSIHFFRKQKGTWWCLIALAFALPLVSNTALCLSHGLPPLPYGLAYPDQQLLPTAHDNYSTAFIRNVVVDITWDEVTPIMAVALAWAYFADRKARA